MWTKNNGAEAPSLSRPESSEDHSIWGVPRRKGRWPPVCLGQGRVLSAFQEPKRNRPRASLSQRAPGPAGS